MRPLEYSRKLPWKIFPSAGSSSSGLKSGSDDDGSEAGSDKEELTDAFRALTPEDYSPGKMILPQLILSITKFFQSDPLILCTQSPSSVLSLWDL